MDVCVDQIVGEGKPRDYLCNNAEVMVSDRRDRQIVVFALALNLPGYVQVLCGSPRPWNGSRTTKPHRAPPANP